MAMPAYGAVFSMLSAACRTSPTSSRGFELFTRLCKKPSLPTLLSYWMPVFCSTLVFRSSCSRM